MVTVARWREATIHLTSRYFSQWRAYRLLGLSRSVAWYRIKGRDIADWCNRLKALAECYPHHDYLTPHEAFKQGGRMINRKRTYRIYREEGLQAHLQRRIADASKSPLIGILIYPVSKSCSPPVSAGTRDEHAHFIGLLGRRYTIRPWHKILDSDDGLDLTYRTSIVWTQRTSLKLHFIQPRKPTQSTFSIASMGKFREYSMDMHSWAT